MASVFWFMAKMADSELEAKCRATNSLQNRRPSEKQNCAKCPEFEQQLQRIIEKLSSLQQIVQILRNEYIHEDFDAAQTQQIGAVSERNDIWKTMSTRSPKIYTKGNIESLNSTDQIAMENRYTVLERMTNIPGNDTKLQTVQANNLTEINTRQSRNKIYTRRDCLITSKSKEESNMKTKVQPNPRNPSCAYKQPLLKEEQETYTIPTITNGQISNEEVRKTVNQRTVLQKVMQ